MKKLLAAIFVALLMAGCGEEASKEQVKDDLGIPVAIPCMACKKLVSEKSEKCMQCGHPTPESVVAYKSRKINTARNWVNGPGKAAVTTYYLQAGEYPTTLDALLTPPAGVKTAVVEKASGLLDPWKKKYQYTPPPGQRNPGSFDLWTTAPDGTEIGNWNSE
jgi:hypothetical protein